MISVCLTTYNGEKFIKEQLDSILPQLSNNDEIIISDDNSSDNTIKIIESYNDKRITVYKNNKSKGVINNFENALENVNGDFIFLSDQDDVWLPNKIKVCLEAFKKTDLVVSDCYITNQDLKILHESFYKVNKTNKTKFGALYRNSYLGCCMAFKRDVLEKALPFPKKIPMHDIWIGNIAAFYFQVEFIPNKLIYYRRHEKNISTASEKSNNSVFKKITYRINLIINLIDRK